MYLGPRRYLELLLCEMLIFFFIASSKDKKQIFKSIYKEQRVVTLHHL